MATATDGSRWITIGGKKQGDREHVGGFPVQISADGRIIKGGPKGLVGKKISDVGKFFRRSRGQKKAAKQSRDIFKRQAEGWEMDPAEYRKLADEVYDLQRDHHNAREKAKTEARRRLGVTAADIRRWENEGFDVASGKIKGVDTLGRELARHYPELGWGGGYGEETGDEDYDQKLWDLLSEGKRELPAKNSEEFHQSVDDYLAALTEQYGDPDEAPDNQKEELWAGVVEDSPVPFSLVRPTPGNPHALPPIGADEVRRIANWATGRGPRPSQ